MSAIAAENRDVRYFICFEDAPESETTQPELQQPELQQPELQQPDAVPSASTQRDDRFLTMQQLILKGSGLIAGGDRSFKAAYIDPGILSVLLFTSGTTSMSKGVMLSHSNIACNVGAIGTVIKIYPTDVHLSLLPLHHTFENTVGLLFMVYSGVCICYCDGIKYIAQNLCEYGVSVLVAVPAILESMYRKLQDGIRKSGKQKLVSILVGFSQFLRFFGIDIRKKLFKSIFAQVGPRLRLAVSGAAPLDPKVVVGFGKLGLSLLEGYGLTETSPVVAANNDFVIVPGTIGYPLAGVDMAIDAPDANGLGEIITRGGNIMLGYYEDALATAAATTADGWFRTGDVGYIDKKGLTRITGRAKSMIVFNSGKKAFPEEYELLLNNMPGVRESFAWGNKAPDGDIQVCVELVIDQELLNGETGRQLDEKETGAFFDAKIKEINKTLPQYKKIRNFIMSRDELVKTTTLKIKRTIESEKVTAALEKAGIGIRRAHGRFI